MRIEQLKYFLEVAKCKNISQAADNLFIGQSTVSSAIIALEKELNIKLMKRTSHGVLLTPIGEEILPIIRSMIKQSQQLKSIADQKLVTKQEIILIINPSALNILLTKILPEMRNLYELKRFQIRETYAGTVIKKIQANQGTIGITAGSARGIRQAKIYAKKNKLTLEVLNKKDTLVLCCNQSNKFAKRNKVSFFELPNEPFALFEGILPNRSITGTYSTYQNFSQIYLFSNQDTLKKAIILYDFVSILPLSVCKDDLNFQSNLLTTVPIVDFDINLAYYIIYRSDAQLSPLERTCVEKIRLYYSE